MVISWQRTDEHRCSAHRQQRPEENSLAAYTVSVVTGQIAAKRAHKETDSHRRERGKNAYDRLGCMEENLAEPTSCSSSVDEEVITFDRRSDHRGEGNLACFIFRLS
ncbi:hypothetical protein D3C76_1592970 [compost metagenome]